MIRLGRLLLPFMILIVLLSCQTERARSYTEDETASAFSLLSSDMMDYISLSGDIPAEVIEDALPLSFSAYSDIIPLYDEIAYEYSAQIASIASPLLPAAYPAVESAMADISSSHPVDLIPGDRAFTEAIRESAWSEVRSIYLALLETHEDEISAAFEVPYSTFISVRKAYENLASVGGEMAIPYPVPFTAGSLSNVLSDILFSRLGEAEQVLKNSPLSDIESPYAIFWEV